MTNSPTSLFKQSLTSTASTQISVIGCQPSRSRGINAVQLETGHSIHTVDGLPIEVETIPVGMNELTQTYNSVAC